MHAIAGARHSGSRVCCRSRRRRARCSPGPRLIPLGRASEARRERAWHAVLSELVGFRLLVDGTVCPSSPFADFEESSRNSVNEISRKPEASSYMQEEEASLFQHFLVCM